MIGARARMLLASLALSALVTTTAGPGCGGRPGSCPGFDSCSDASKCPLMRCICDGGPLEFPATCRTDGTCFTVSDCASLCAKKGSKCAKPPATCDAYLATECSCSSTKTSYTEAWDCVQGEQSPPSQKDCDDTCGNNPASGAGGGGGAFPAVTSAGGSVPVLTQAAAGGV